MTLSHSPHKEKNMNVVNKRTHTPTTKDVYIGRPSVLGNPFSHLSGTLAEHRVATRDEAIKAYTQWLVDKVKVERDPLILAALRAIPEDAHLVCWCKPQSCHGDIIVKACAWLKQHPEY